MTARGKIGLYLEHRHDLGLSGWFSTPRARPLNGIAYIGGGDRHDSVRDFPASELDCPDPYFGGSHLQQAALMIAVAGAHSLPLIDCRRRPFAPDGEL